MSEKRLKFLRNGFCKYIRNHFKEPFLCLMGCNEMILPKLYEVHCKEIHHMKPQLQCVWCQGKVSWLKGYKYKHMEHVMQCINNLLKPAPTIIQRENGDERLILFDSAPTCKTKCSFDNYFEKNLTYDIDPKHFLSDSGSETISEYYRSSRRNTLEFQIEDINLARKYVGLYLSSYTPVKFVHIMIRRPAFESFVSRMEYDPNSKFLEFYCWCDGGDSPHPHLRQHIHLILVTSNYDNFKEKVWNELAIDRSFCPPSNYKCKFSKDAQSAYHLVNIIGYVSNRKSKCQFHKQKSNEDALNHFYINKALPKDFRYCLVTQWNNGLKEFVEGKHRNYCPTFGQEGLTQDNRGRWQIPYKYLPYIHRNLVLPIKTNFLPTEEESEARIYLTKKRIMYFKEYDENVQFSPLDQASKGNVFLKVIDTDVFYPRSKGQQILNSIDGSLHHEKKKHQEIIETIKQTLNSEYESILANKNEKNMELENIIKCFHQNEIEPLKKQNSELEKINTNQNEKMMELEKINTNQNEKMMELEKINTNQNEKNIEQEKIITFLKQTEIESLKQRNNDLEKYTFMKHNENEYLKKRNSELEKYFCLNQNEIESLKKRNSELESIITVYNQKEIKSLKNKNKELKRIIKYFYQKEVEPLKKEIVELKKEIVELKIRNCRIEKNHRIIQSE